MTVIYRHEGGPILTIDYGFISANSLSAKFQLSDNVISKCGGEKQFEIKGDRVFQYTGSCIFELNGPVFSKFNGGPLAQVSDSQITIYGGYDKYEITGYLNRNELIALLTIMFFYNL